jgi:hypothetical protein
MKVEIQLIADEIEKLELCSEDYRRVQKMLRSLGNRSSKFYGNLYQRADGLLYMYFEKTKSKAKKAAAGDCLLVAVPVRLNFLEVDLSVRART